MWANDANGGSGGCLMTHSPILVTTPPRQIGAVGTPAQLQVSATNALPGQSLTYTAANLPAGLTINSASGLISGTPTVAGRVTVTVTVAHAPNSNTVTFRWVVRRH